MLFKKKVLRSEIKIDFQNPLFTPLLVKHLKLKFLLRKEMNKKRSIKQTHTRSLLFNHNCHFAQS